MCLVAVRRNDKGIIGRALPFWLKPKQIGLLKETGLLKSKALVYYFVCLLLLFCCFFFHPVHGLSRRVGGGVNEEEY